MKKKLLFVSILAVFASLPLSAMTCTCTSGSMTVEFKDGKTSISCTGGGRVSCEIPFYSEL
ncbi:hypothetical protein [Rheinheimera metallidurans]|uniref:hypothetical protein n=1 Tax=Rheinheimera metallidurans TaxID=2925781 RepID=UPI003001D078